MVGRNTWDRMGKPAVASVLAGALLFGVPGGPVLSDKALNWTMNHASAADGAQATSAVKSEPQLTLVDEQIVTAGVRKRSYVWSRISRTTGKPLSTNVTVISADLQNPNVKLDVMVGSGANGKVTEKANVLQMAQSTGAAAGVNGDFFDMKISEPSPLGPQIAGGMLQTTPTVGLEGMYAFGITKDNKPIIETFTSQGSVVAANGQKYKVSGLNRVVSTLGNAIYMYDSSWGAAKRARDATPHTEVLVVGGIVQSIHAGSRYEGEIPEGGYILSAGGEGAKFIADHVRIGDPISASVSLVPVNPNLTYSENDLKMLIGGHTMLVIDGVPAAYTRDVSSINGNTARTAVGFTQDRRYVYLVTADDAAGSVGPTLSDFQRLLIQLGVWRAVNLDGGGSTTVVSRPLGEFEAQLANTPKEGVMRRVVNGIGVYSTSPPGALMGLIVDGPRTLWKGQEAAYSVKAYDVNYNPLDPKSLSTPVTFGSDGGKLVYDAQADRVKAAAGGTDVLVASSGGVKHQVNVEIIDQSLVQRLEVVPDKSPSLWVPGDAIPLTVRAQLADGRSGTIPPEAVRWELYGIQGTASAGAFTFGGFAEGAETALLVARFDGFSVPLAVPVPQERTAVLADFDSVKPEVRAESYPVQAQSDVKLLGPEEDLQLHLSYEFDSADGTTDFAAYAALGGDGGIQFEAGAQALRLNMFGDGQGGWARAELTDADGKIRRVTLAENVDWVGWRTLTVNLQDFDARALERIYILSKSPIGGEVVFDDLKVVYLEDSVEREQPPVSLTIDKKEMVVGNEMREMDVAPRIEESRTFVPVRFVVDALGGAVDWDPAAKKVTVRKGEHFIELWVGQLEMIADGERRMLDASPRLRDSRTTLPLRFVTEQLGYQVDYDPEKRTISIR